MTPRSITVTLGAAPAAGIAPAMAAPPLPITAMRRGVLVTAGMKVKLVSVPRYGVKHDMTHHPQRLPIGAFAEAAGVHVETIRLYQRKGLLPTPGRAYGTIRQYDASDVARVRFVKSAQRLGFTLYEVRALLTLDDGTHCADARVLPSRSWPTSGRSSTICGAWESALSRLVVRCGKARGRISCPLIAALHTA